MNTNTVAATATTHAQTDYAKCVDFSDVAYYATTVRANAPREYVRAYEDEMMRLVGGFADSK